MTHLDWDQLRRTSLNPGGFGSERATIWPQVLNASTSTIPPPSEPTNNGELAAHETGESMSHRDERQITLDTDRSFVHYPSGMSDAVKEEMKTKLNELIVSVFRKRSALNYYQGYHDIISVLFLTLPPELQSRSVEKLSLHRLRDSMGPGLEPVLGLLRLLKNLLRLVDPEYAQLLERNIPTPFYALSNLLTLFSHDMPTLALIQHTFDYLLVRPPVACVYVAAAIILSRKEEITWLEAVGEEGMLHSILSSLPVLFEEGEENDSQLPAPTTEGTQEIKGEDTAIAVCEEREVDALPNGYHIPESITKSEGPAVVELAVDALTSTPPLAGVRENVLSLPTESPPIPSDVAGNLPTPSPDVSTIETDTTVLDGDPFVTKPPASTENDITLVDEPITKVEFEQTKASPSSTPTPPSEPEPEVSDLWPDTPGQPAKARISLSSLLRQADDIFAQFPPSHPNLDLDKIMGTRSVIFTWTESFSSLPPDDELEQYVTTPHLVVLPYVDPVEEAMKEKRERELEMRKVARRGAFGKSIFARANMQKKTMLAGAVLALGIAMAVYGIRTPSGRPYGAPYLHLSKVLRYIGGLLLAGGDKFVGRLLGY